MIEAIGRFVDDTTMVNNPGDRGLWFYKKKQDYSKTRINGQRVAEILMRENVRSVNYRYSETKRVPKVKVTDKSYSPTPAEVGRYIRELRYQSCERKDFDRSDARKVMDLINELALERLARETGAKGWTGGWE
jgi:hypothetical protein